MTEIHRLQLEYAEKQPWFLQFIVNTINAPYSCSVTAGESIVNTFFWRDSPEGEGFWSDIENELQELVNGTTNVQEILDLYPKNKYPEYYI